MTLSARVQHIGQQIAAASGPNLSSTLCAGLQSLLGWPYKVAPKFVFDAHARTETFAAVIYTTPDAALALEDGAIPADNAAAVIDASERLDLAGFQQAYARTDHERSAGQHEHAGNHLRSADGPTHRGIRGRI